MLPNAVGKPLQALFVQQFARLRGVWANLI
jgi:hypothetical protein